MKKNLRKSLTSDALVVCGTPVNAGSVPAGHQLVLVDDDRFVTFHAGSIWFNGQPVTSVAGTLVGVHRVGDMLVVAGTEGIAYLTRQANGYAPLDPDAAEPAIEFQQQSLSPLTAAIPATALSRAYAQWQAPLDQPDVNALRATLRDAWRHITEQAETQAAYLAPLLVRYGVRLWDDTYLCVSTPTTLGANLADNGPQVVTDAVISGNVYNGLEAATLQVPCYALHVSVSQGIPDNWRPMVKAIDILMAGPAQVVASTTTLNYRFITSSGGQRVARLQYGFPLHSAPQVNAQLRTTDWQVIDSTTDFEALARGTWVSTGVDQPRRLTPQQCDDLQPRPLLPVATLACNGRLYCATAQGRVTSSVPGNPLVVERERLVTGVKVLAMTAVPRSLYSGGFGRYPIYLFTDEGIYALPLTAQNAYGEPRLVHRMVIAAGTAPVEANREVMFASASGHLCRLRGSYVTVVARQVNAHVLTYDNEHDELWLINSQGQVQALLNDDSLSLRTTPLVSLYHGVNRSLGVTAQGQVLNLTLEETAQMPVEWVSDTFTNPKWVQAPPKQAVWDVVGDDVDVVLDVLGERGVSCHGFLVSRLSVNGRVAAPLRVPMFAPPLRTIRFRVAGLAASGTTFYPPALS